jgi:hypothetical protein
VHAARKKPKKVRAWITMFILNRCVRKPSPSIEDFTDFVLRPAPLVFQAILTILQPPPPLLRADAARGSA